MKGRDEVVSGTSVGYGVNSHSACPRLCAPLVHVLLERLGLSVLLIAMLAQDGCEVGCSVSSARVLVAYTRLLFGRKGLPLDRIGLGVQYLPWPGGKTDSRLTRLGHCAASRTLFPSLPYLPSFLPSFLPLFCCCFFVDLFIPEPKRL